ncbi:hypothetical protein [Porphyromonas sp. COT-239 OH1446]|nr:hypothetical protein [Porphyromonas sp. COT-239 OH1446]
MMNDNEASTSMLHDQDNDETCRWSNTADGNLMWMLVWGEARGGCLVG